MEISNQFLAKGIGMLVDGTDAKMIKSSLTNDIGGMKQRHEMSAAILDAGEKYAPATWWHPRLVNVFPLWTIPSPLGLHGGRSTHHYVWRYFGEYDFRSHVRKLDYSAGSN